MTGRRRLLVAACLLGAAASLAVLLPGQPTPAARSLAARVDLSRTLGHDAPFLRDYNPSALYVGAALDQIPAIDQPVFDTPEQASRLLRPESLVVGVERHGDARAYPTNLLSLHEVVNDVVGGEPIAITWCPLCSTALAFDRRVGDRSLTFGVSGFLYHANLVLYDRQTGSLWSQLLGGAITGSHRGAPLRPVPVVHQTWAAWRSAHPDTKVLSIRRDVYADRFTQPSVEVTGYGEESTESPYSSYTNKVDYYFRKTVRGVQDSERVFGIVVGGRAKAYPLGLLRRRGTVTDVVAGVPVVVRYDDDAYSAVAFARGERLPGTFSYWFAWRRIHARTAVYRG